MQKKRTGHDRHYINTFKNLIKSLLNSGFNINKNGLIVTNYHVVEGASEIVVEFLNGDRYPVNYYTYVDERKDFALLKISGKRLPVHG